jgi:DNA-binding CsgD family transcriptional regulator
LAGFTALLSGPDRVRWGTSFHNWIKTWYAPLLFRPLLFLRGVRLLFGDHAMFFRRADFLAVGGCDPTLLVMEEADLCIRFHRLGRTRLVNRVVITSDRRVAAWGYQGTVPGPAVVAYIHSDTWSSADRCDQLAQLFDLIPCEARLALALSRGMSIAEAAVELGLTIESARTYSKRIYAKTAARGQVDLVRFIHRSVLAIA